MRVTFLLTLIFVLLLISTWVTLSGIFFILGCLFTFFLLVLTIGYADTAILFYLGAREVRSTDEPAFFKAASQEAYKLAIRMPKLYFYNGTLERGYILESRHSYSIVVNKALLESCRQEELDAICFELLLQVKQGMAGKRTKVMFMLGTMSWLSHSILSLVMRIIPSKEARQAADWFLGFLLHPMMSFLFSLTLGEAYFKKLKGFIAVYPVEDEQIMRLGLKLRKPQTLYSLPSRKMIELSSVTRNTHFQNILALEFLPHEWDSLFMNEERIRA